MTEAGFSVKPGKSAKAQVSEGIKLLQTHSQLPIQRARMRVKVTVPKADAESVRVKVLESAESVEKTEEGGEEWETVRALRHRAEARWSRSRRRGAEGVRDDRP